MESFQGQQCGVQHGLQLGMGLGRCSGLTAEGSALSGHSGQTQHSGSTHLRGQGRSVQTIGPKRTRAEAAMEDPAVGLSLIFGKTLFPSLTRCVFQHLEPMIE